MKIIFTKLVLFIGFISLIFSQQVPNAFLELQVHKLLTDAGQNWETNTMFGPHRFQSISKTNLKNSVKVDSLNVRTWAGIFTKNGATALHGFAHLSFKKHYYGYLFPRIFNDPDVFMRFGSMQRDVYGALRGVRDTVLQPFMPDQGGDSDTGDTSQSSANYSDKGSSKGGSKAGRMGSSKEKMAKRESLKVRKK